MENFEGTILRWMSLFDEFNNIEYLSTKHLISSASFKQFVDDVFCLKCSSALNTDDTKVYDTIKVNYCEFGVLNYEDLYNEDNAIYACVIVLLHALLKCTNDKFRNQLSERMNDEEQVLLANFLEATQSSLFTKQNISEALLLINDSKHTCVNVSEICSNNDTPIKSKSMRRSYLQEFCQSPKSQSLINQEKEKLIAKLTEDYKNECEENYKLAESVKYLKDLNTKLSNKLEDKDKILQMLKDDIKEFSKPNQSPEFSKTDNDLIIKKLNRDKIDLEMNCNELKQQITELDKKHKDLNGRFEMKTLDYNNLIVMFDNIENENILLKSNLKLFEETIQKKDTEITSLKDELCNKSITNNPTNISGQENNAVPSNTLFNELSCLKLEEITHDKEKYRHKYKSIKKDLSNTKMHVKELNEKIVMLEKKLVDYETHKDELIDQFSNKIKELQECQKKNNNLESKIKHLKDTIQDNENHIESLCSKLNKRDKQIELLSVEIDSVKKSKTMIELILSKTNTEIEAIHEEHDEKVKNVQSIIEEYKNSEKLSNQKILDLENNIKNIQDNLANKEHVIIFYEEKMAENYQIVGSLEEQLKTMYQEKLMLESHLKHIKIEIETQQKSFSDKNCEMENCLEYYLDELKDLKNEKTKLSDSLHCKQNELEQQLKLINNQKDMIKTLQSEQCSRQLIINELNEVLQQRSSENNDLCVKVLESTVDLDKLKEQLNAALAENNIMKTNLRNEELKIKSMNEEFQHQINDMKDILENQNNQSILKVEKLQDTLEKKQNDFDKQLVTCNELTEIISQLHLEKYELEEKLKSNSQDLDQKQMQFEQITEEHNKLKETVEYAENQCIDLEQTLKESKNIILKKEEDIKLFKADISEFSISKENLQKQIIEVQQNLNNKHIELENQIQCCNEQRDTIVKLNDEKECLSNKIRNLEDSLSHYEYKFNLCEGKLYDCSNSIDTLEKQLYLINNEKSLLELQLNETITKLTLERDNLINITDVLESTLLNKDNVIADNQEKLLEYKEINDKIITEKSAMEVKLTQRLEEMEHNLSGLQEIVNCKHLDLETREKENDQLLKTISSLSLDKDNLINETKALKDCLLEKEKTLSLSDIKLLGFEKQNKELECQNTLMVKELNELKCQLNNVRQELTEEIDRMDKKLLEAQEQLSYKQSEIKLKNDSITDIYHKVNYLKNMKVELESILKNERKNVETCFETCLNSLYQIKNKPVLDQHHDSLIEVITSADTFIEQNGIQLARVENCDEYSIIERVKKVFEALKMFIISLKTQGNEQIMNHTNNESNDAYTELLALSKTQQKTIKHLETEMATLKTECVYKMTKVQQKTQEYVTSEYEKKFERKREQMKQFCKDLEAKIHQDFEAKLLKYKDKINKDEIHIKELGQQLWEVSEKYLRLQQKDRRESTMSLPFEMSMISETATTLPKYNSFTLPKSSSAGQIRSLVEETTRCYQDNTKRNVPAGIGKKFSLSSGKIFPKEEDEEGEMFNHSCLADLKQGRVRLNDNKKQYNERLSELQARNSLCPPHLRSCYAAETNFLPNTSLVSEEDIKTTANCSDYETENLIPNDRTKKKDRNQTSYKKPGPPTPSKNGGRVSLSSNQKITLKESKESNTNKRRTSSTPNKLFSLFMSKKN